MKTLFALFVVILIAGCEKSNPVSNNDPVISISVTPDNIFFDVHSTTQPTYKYLTITNPASSTENLVGRTSFIDSSINKGAFDIDNGQIDFETDSTYSVAPGAIKTYRILFYPKIKNVLYKSSFIIYHNDTEKPEPIIIPINGYCS